MSLEQLLLIDINSVYGASGFKQKISEAPASVIIITSDEIKSHGYRTLADILRNVRSCYVSYDRNYSYLGVRGYGPPGDYNSRVAVMIDGHRLAENIFNASSIGTDFPIDVDLIDRVEVIRGPNSSLYVASAFLGVVNIITKRGRALNNVHVAGDAASFGTYQGRLTYGNTFGSGLEVLLSASSYKSQGQGRLFFKDFDAPATNNGIAVNADDDRSVQYFANVRWGDFTSHGVFGSREKGIPTASFGTVFNDAGTRTIDARGYLDLQYRREFARGWILANQAYYDRFTNDGTYIYDYSSFGGPSRVVNKNYSHGQWLGDELSVSKPVFGTHRITIGSSYRDNFQQDQGNFDVRPVYRIPKGPPNFQRGFRLCTGRGAPSRQSRPERGPSLRPLFDLWWYYESARGADLWSVGQDDPQVPLRSVLSCSHLVRTLLRRPRKRGQPIAPAREGQDHGAGLGAGACQPL